MKQTYWFDRPPMEGIIKQGSFRAYGHTIGPAQRALEAWIGGRPLSPFIPWEDEYFAREDPSYNGYLVIEGKKIPGLQGMSWSVRFAQSGYPSRYGMASGSSAEDACDHAIELISEDEAQRLGEIIRGLA